MTGEIANFDFKDLWEHGGLLLGDNAERTNTVNYLVGSRGVANGPLIVLDADGRLYSRYGGRGLLVDFESANGFIPNAYAPIVNHRKYGRSPAQTAKLIADVAIKEKQDRTSNDAYWSQSGTQTLREYVEYGLLFAHINKRDGVSTGNVLLDFASAHDYLSELMGKFIASGADETDRWRPPSEKQRSADFIGSRRNVQQNPLTGEEMKFQEVLSFFYGDAPIPFCDTLAVFAKNAQTNMPNSTLKTAQSMGRRLLDFNRMLSDEIDYIEKLRRLDLNAFVKGEESSGKNVIFVVPGADRDVSSVSAILTVLGCAAAADAAEKQITCLVQDVSVSDVFDGMVKIQSIFPSAVKLIVGCGDLMRASRRTDMSPSAYFDKLADIAGQNIIWHKSKNDLLTQLFHERASGLSLMYGLPDLGGNGLVAVEQGGDIGYAYIPSAGDTGISQGVREERKYNGEETRSLWFYFQTRADSEDTVTNKELANVQLDLDAAIEEAFCADGDSGNE